MSIVDRIYEDYLKKSRLPEYRKTLQVAKKHGYQMVSVLDFTRLVRADGLNGKKIYLNRHDIDTSPKIAAKMFAIEKEIYGKEGTASYYFRDSTTDIQLIHDIDAYGYETGYHYEELATYIKKHKLKNKEDIKNHIRDAGMQFLIDLRTFREITGSQSQTVASHGDFINTRFDIQSYEMLKIPEIRDKAEIVAEAYDEDIMRFVQERYADHILVSDYTMTVINAFEHECPIVMTLSHPRNWNVDVLENTKENWRRIYQDIRFRL